MIFICYCIPVQEQIKLIAKFVAATETTWVDLTLQFLQYYYVPEGFPSKQKSVLMWLIGTEKP